MTIDLKQPISLHLEVRERDDSAQPIPIVVFEPQSREEGEIYRTLFEEAPRRKLEHGKMLAMLKRVLDPAFADKSEIEALVVVNEMCDLVDEVEASER